MRRLLLPSLALTALATGCAQPKTYAANCSVPLKHWKTPTDGYDLGLRNILNVDRLGQIQWNDTDVSEARFREYLKSVPTIEPPPEMILKFNPDVDCETVARVRNEIDRALSCGKAVSCGEGEGDWEGNTRASDLPSHEAQKRVGDIADKTAEAAARAQ
ncbi:MAG: ExbD/TolR family protein [Chakrabartia godavariana]